MKVEATQMQEELAQMRRVLHSCPEIGDHLPKTKAFVIDKLLEYGYAPQEICESGIVAVLEGAKPGKTLMLRAEMDALPIREETNLNFAASNGCMHACGHDLHTAMLLGAAKLLKQYQKDIAGCVKFIFQPNEEGFGGAKAMLKAGCLKDPHVDAAMALHVHSGTPSGMVLCGKGTFMAGCTLFQIRMKGKGCHGAMPESGVDPINIAAHIFLSLQEIIAREISPVIPASLTIGRLTAGTSPNIIPEEAWMEGSIRTPDGKTGEYIYRRIREIAQQTAKLFGGQAEIEEISSVPPLKNNTELLMEMREYIGQICEPEKILVLEQGGMGSEDFAVFSQRIPCAYLLLGAGTAQEQADFGKPMHNASVVFNEDILSKGSAVLAHCAFKWLENAGN